MTGGQDMQAICAPQAWHGRTSGFAQNGGRARIVRCGRRNQAAPADPRKACRQIQRGWRTGSSMGGGTWASQPYSSIGRGELGSGWRAHSSLSGLADRQVIARMPRGVADEADQPASRPKQRDGVEAHAAGAITNEFVGQTAYEQRACVRATRFQCSGRSKATKCWIDRASDSCLPALRIDSTRS